MNCFPKKPDSTRVFAREMAPKARFRHYGDAERGIAQARMSSQESWISKFSDEFSCRFEPPEVDNVPSNRTTYPKSDKVFHSWAIGETVRVLWSREPEQQPLWNKAIWSNILDFKCATRKGWFLCSMRKLRVRNLPLTVLYHQTFGMLRYSETQKLKNDPEIVHTFVRHCCGRIPYIREVSDRSRVKFNIPFGGHGPIWGDVVHFLGPVTVYLAS